MKRYKKKYLLKVKEELGSCSCVMVRNLDFHIISRICIITEKLLVSICNDYLTIYTKFLKVEISAGIWMCIWTICWTMVCPHVTGTVLDISIILRICYHSTGIHQKSIDVLRGWPTPWWEWVARIQQGEHLVECVGARGRFIYKGELVNVISWNRSTV